MLSGERLVTVLLALVTALASSGGFWQTIQRAAFEEQAIRCGESVVAITNAIGEALR